MLALYTISYLLRYQDINNANKNEEPVQGTYKCTFTKIMCDWNVNTAGERGRNAECVVSVRKTVCGVRVQIVNVDLSD